MTAKQVETDDRTPAASNEVRIGVRLHRVHLNRLQWWSPRTKGWVDGVYGQEYTLEMTLQMWDLLSRGFIHIEPSPADLAFAEMQAEADTLPTMFELLEKMEDVMEAMRNRERNRTPNEQPETERSGNQPDEDDRER